ncbi:MAG: hypothetical protein HKN42_03070, partial [Granulosicoccus sp.]|nr:hypothetical protein [Granulosicoccus sp.]
MKTNLIMFLAAAVYLFDSVAGVSQAHANGQTATLVNTTELFNWTVPSPDPAGVVFVPGADSLFVTDSEVNETGLFTGSNMFQAGIDGSLYETFSTIEFTSEPTGITVNPANGHLFISEDDSPRRIYEIDPGPDGIYRNTDDIITSFSTSAFGSWDAEGLTFNPADGRLYIAGGAIDLVYVVDPGANQLFDGVSPAGDDTVTSFDVSLLGITDPEGIAYDSLTDALYVVGKPIDKLLHVSTSGELLRLLTLDSPLLQRPAGLGMGPSSLQNGAQSLYLVDRGDDNNYDPLENDGRLFEFSLPPLPANQAPVVAISAPVQGESFAANSAVTFIGTATDAEDGDLSASLVWTSDRDGTIGNGPQFDISTLSTGQHTITASCIDSSQAAGLSMLSVLVYPQGSYVLETRVDSSSDDAEQRGLNGNTWIDGNDLELIQDNSVEQIVGLRFNTLQIPANATIEEAYIRFQADEVQTGAVTLEIRAQ